MFQHISSLFWLTIPVLLQDLSAIVILNDFYRTPERLALEWQSLFDKSVTNIWITMLPKSVYKIQVCNCDLHVTDVWKDEAVFVWRRRISFNEHLVLTILTFMVCWGSSQEFPTATSPFVSMQAKTIQSHNLHFCLLTFSCELSEASSLLCILEKWSPFSLIT